MWLLKYTIFDKEGIFSQATKQANVELEGFPLNYYQDENNYYFIATGFVKGTETRKKKFIIVDAAMNDLMRPALYSAWQEIIPVSPKKEGQSQ